jgi:trehalose 2-sulfotransferase
LVFLRRQDRVRQAVSYYRALLSDTWWAYDDAAASTRRPVVDDPPIDPEMIDLLLRRCASQEQEWQEFFSRFGVRPLTVTYEEMATDLGGTVTAVLRHAGLELPRATWCPTPRLVRQADGWTDEAVHRYVTWRRMQEPVDEHVYGFDAVE